MSAGSTSDPRSIAVLPFTNRSPVAEDEFFIDGIHDDLLTNLSRIGDLKVISRTSVTRFRDTDTPIPDIAKELGVATVMEGAVQRAGDTVRINVQLIDAASDEQLDEGESATRHRQRRQHTKRCPRHRAFRAHWPVCGSNITGQASS